MSNGNRGGGARAKSGVEHSPTAGAGKIAHSSASVPQVIGTAHDAWWDVAHWKHVGHVLQRILGEFILVAATLGSLEGVHYLVGRVNASPEFRQWFASAHEAASLGMFAVVSLRFLWYLAKRKSQ